MAQRVMHTLASADKLTAFPHAQLGTYANGIVITVADDAALALMPRAPAFSLLFFTREAFDYELRQLPEPERDAAVRMRLANWSSNAINNGVPWLVRRQRRCLALTAIVMHGPQRVSLPADHVEHSMVALHGLVNDGAYGSSMLTAMLILLLEREALLASELSSSTPAELGERKPLSAGVAQALAALGRPQFAQYPPYAEARRAALVVPADQPVRQLIKMRARPSIDWRGGVVSLFGVRDIEHLTGQGKAVRMLYASGNDFVQDFADLSRGQLLRELEERLQAGPAPFWSDYVNALRLDVALLRRACHEKAMAENAQVAAQLAPQIPRDNALLSMALARQPSWIADQGSRAQITLIQAETELLEDATFLVGASGIKGYEDLHQRYRAFAEFKARQRQKL